MKINKKQFGFCMMMGFAAIGSTSCNDLLDLDPVSQITPESYYGSADQLASYLTNFYTSYLTAPFSGAMFHNYGYNDGMAQSDGNTDIMLVGLGGNTTLFANDHWEVSSGKVLQAYYAPVRVYNYFLEKAVKGYEDHTITGDETLIKNYIGEGYFFRALCYYRILALYGDAPIVKEVLEDKNELIVENSCRAPRNEVARFILEDLDKAVNLLADRSLFNGQRVNRESALLLKSRVALFEATFEKYHKGSGRVPGDAGWPGAKMAYNSGKTFDIDGEISFFLTEAMKAAKEAVGGVQLTVNTHVMEPALNTITGWNNYFEMFSQPSLVNVPEVLLWKEYDYGQTICHDVPYRVLMGSADGYTRSFTESFLTKDGLPIYADPDNYQGDVSIDMVKAGRDERLQLFVWSESTLTDSDPSSARYGNKFGLAGIARENQETRCITGYQPRKYYTYDYAQTPNDEVRGSNACPIFRTAEAMLNYMEACYEKNGRLDADAENYWKALRRRAGVSEDYAATVNATDLSKEKDFGVYSGTVQVDKTLYNIRRERMNELFSEGHRFADLIRWRSFDKMITTKWIPEGVNFWDEMYSLYDEEFKSDGSSDAVISGSNQGKYLRPYSRNQQNSNELKDGYNWHEAYYLYPIGIGDIRTGSADRDLENSNMYQNVNWPLKAGGHAEK